VSTVGAGRARWAAIAAIACLVAALVTGCVAIVNDVWRLVVDVAALAVAVLGAWYGVAARGMARAAGILIAVLGLATFLAVTLTASHRGVALVLTIALAAASAWSASIALRSKHQPSDSVLPLAGADPPRRPVLIMNPKSGGGKVTRFNLTDECRTRGIEPVLLQPGDDLRRLAADAISSGADVIGMAGGDGSQALVASVAAEHGVPYVCVPAGTRNHLALDLGIDRDNVVAALDAFAAGRETRIDLAEVNGRVFVNNASMGLYARIVQSDEYRDAKLRTATDMLPDLLGGNPETFDLRFEGPGGSLWSSAHMLLVSNNPYELDRLIGGGTRPRMDSGKLGVVAARVDGPRDAVALVGLQATGMVRAFRGWVEWDATEFTVDSSAPVEIGVDGEAMSMKPPLVFRSRPGALRVRLPPTARGAGPAADSIRLGASMVNSMIRIAAGKT
jgi:diacylglycerol kinase family enzyme